MLKSEQKFTDELKSVFSYIKETLLKSYSTNIIGDEYFLVAIFNQNCVANKILRKLMLDEAFERGKNYFNGLLIPNEDPTEHDRLYNPNFSNCINEAAVLSEQQNSQFINSGHVLVCVLRQNQAFMDYLKRECGVSLTELKTLVSEESKINVPAVKDSTKTRSLKPVKHEKKPKMPTDTVMQVIFGDNPFGGNNPQMGTNGKGEAESFFMCINDYAKAGAFEPYIGGEEQYDELLTALSKRSKNNAVIVGPSGVGKSHFVMNLARKIENKDVPAAFLDKKILSVKFPILFEGAGMRGVFEARSRAIFQDAEKKGNYIFFVDAFNINENGNVSSNDIETFMSTLFLSRNIMCIITCNEKQYQRQIQNNPEWERQVTKVTIQEPDEDTCMEILRTHARRLEEYHNVSFNDETLLTAIKLSKKFVAERNLPDSAIDIIDATAAKKTLYPETNEKADEVKNKIAALDKRIEELRQVKDYTEIDRLTVEKIELQGTLAFRRKQARLYNGPKTITSDDIKEYLSRATDIPMQELNADDRQKLRGINDTIKSKVIGQDEAVDIVCKGIKAWRVGIKNPNKPLVYIFAGSSGCGKTYLAKTIAQEIFGSPKKLVRFDMGEYADKTSVNKLIGAGSGYIGYENSGLLTNSLRKQKHCVLLLDEIEKADEDIYNVLLAAFDEGKMTDNKGFVIDLKNIIVIMTSNVGAKQVSENGKGIGFVKMDDREMQASIIEKEMKKKFRPEFINRIDKIIYFNKLTGENLRNIIVLEIKKLAKRIEDMGYKLDDSFTCEEVINLIYNKVEEKSEYGARPILRELQNEIEDKITDYIIDHDIEKGHVFSWYEICNKS